MGEIYDALNVQQAADLSLKVFGTLVRYRLQQQIYIFVSRVLMFTTEHGSISQYQRQELSFYRLFGFFYSVDLLEFLYILL